MNTLNKASDADPLEDVQKFADQLTKLETMEIIPEAALKIAKGVLNYGRAEIRIPLPEIEKLFKGKDVGIVHLEYDWRSQCLCVLVEGNGLPWCDSTYRPYVLSGRFTDGSYIMADVRRQWTKS